MAATERPFKADKEKEYRAFVIWRSMPHDIPDELAEKLFAADPLVVELSKIKTQKELASYLKVRPKTISDWKQKEVPPEFKELDWRHWARLATPKVVSALLRELLKTGDARRVTAWFKYVEDHEEKSRHAITDADGGNIGGLAGMIARADKRLKDRGETN